MTVVVINHPLLVDSRLVASLGAWAFVAVVVLLLLWVVITRRSVPWHIVAVILTASLALSIAGIARAFIEMEVVSGDAVISQLETARWVIIVGRTIATLLLLGALMELTQRPRWLLRLF